MTKLFSWRDLAQNQIIPSRIGSDKRGIRLLVVDTDESFIEAIREYGELCSHEYDLEIKFVKSGKEALREQRWEPTVVLLDAYLPDINAFTLLAEFKSKIVPVIFASENRGEDLVSCAAKGGAMSVFFKGIEPEELEALFAKIAEVSIPQVGKH